MPERLMIVNSVASVLISQETLESIKKSTVQICRINVTDANVCVRKREVIPGQTGQGSQTSHYHKERLGTSVRKGCSQPLLKNKAVGFVKRRSVVRLFLFNTMKII